MSKLGTKNSPAVIKVQTAERAEELLSYYFGIHFSTKPKDNPLS
jgi:hypothetical protein